MLYYYGSSISPNKTETVEGFLICKNVPIARTGQQEYLARELQLDGDPNRVIVVNRYEEDVFDKATLASFEGKPVTDGHPAENVSPETFSAYAKGHVQNVRREGDFIVADLHINDANLISEVQNGVKKEVSCGYLCDYVEDGDSYKQTKIRGNHVAVVTNGRAGHDVAIKDAIAVAMEKGNPMSKMLKDVLTAFGMAAKDANPDQLAELVETTAEGLEPQKEKTQEGEPVDAQVEKSVETQDPAPVEPEKDEAPVGLEAKVDTLIELVGTLVKKLSQPEDKAAEKKVELTDEEKIDQAIAALDPEEKPEVEEKPDGEAETIEIEEKDACGCSKDAAAVLRTMRPIVAGISNAEDRKKVTDALLEAYGTKHDMADIMDASRSCAKGAADASAKSNYEKICEEQKNAYSSRNPHYKEV